jgi:hypothetical protein
MVICGMDARCGILTGQPVKKFAPRVAYAARSTKGESDPCALFKLTLLPALQHLQD